MPEKASWTINLSKFYLLTINLSQNYINRNKKKTETAIVTIENELREDSQRLDGSVVELAEQRCVGIKGLVVVETVTAVDAVVLLVGEVVASLDGVDVMIWLLVIGTVVGEAVEEEMPLTRMFRDLATCMLFRF